MHGPTSGLQPRVELTCRVGQRAPPGKPKHRPLVTRCAGSVEQEKPARTCSGAVKQARAAWRRYRESRPEAGPDSEQPHEPWKARIELPLPKPSTGVDSPIAPLDEQDWPGGVEQRFRELKPLVTELLFGYDTRFLGMLEDPADGVGAWALSDTTVVANVANGTFAPFLALCRGEYGAAVLRAGHTLLAVNAQWTRSADIGQLWDWELKRRAGELIDDSAAWEWLYCLRLLRTSRGRQGVLFRSFPSRWRLFSWPDDDQGGGELVLLASWVEQPSSQQVVEVLSSRAAAGDEQSRPWRLW